MVASISSLRSHSTKLGEFVADFGELVARALDEQTILDEGRRLLEGLVAEDDWLADEWRAPDPARYQQYLLHCDDRARFSIVSFVWGPGQRTPIHDHRVWGLVGVLSGAEMSESFVRRDHGRLEARGPVERVESGAVVAVSPRIGDIHRVANAYDDRTSISVHVYGANIGAIERATYDEAGHAKPFVSGYANRAAPHLRIGSSKR
jgi:predicted metal-dependent enzyme (double-stranded beta helix superfamily)